MLMGVKRAANLPFHVSGLLMVMCLSGSSGQKRDVVRRTYPAGQQHSEDAGCSIPASAAAYASLCCAEHLAEPKQLSSEITQSMLRVDFAAAAAITRTRAGLLCTAGLHAASLQEHTARDIHGVLRPAACRKHLVIALNASSVCKVCVLNLPKPWHVMQVPRCPRLPFVGARAHPVPSQMVQLASYTCSTVCSHGQQQAVMEKHPHFSEASVCRKKMPAECVAELQAADSSAAPCFGRL